MLIMIHFIFHSHFRSATLQLLENLKINGRTGQCGVWHARMTTLLVFISNYVPRSIFLLFWPISQKPFEIFE